MPFLVLRPGMLPNLYYWEGKGNFVIVPPGLFQEVPDLQLVEGLFEKPFETNFPDIFIF